MEDPQIGDHWTYEVRDEFPAISKSTITYTITDITPARIRDQAGRRRQADVGYQTYSRSWDMVNNGAWRPTPNDGAGIRAPLSVGKAWQLKATDANSSAGVSLKRSVDQAARKTAKETITTRAGSFEAFKIETSIETRNSNDPTKKYLSEQQIWYRARDQSLGKAHLYQQVRRPSPRQERCRTGRVWPPLIGFGAFHQ